MTATREEEALGILSGAWLGGQRGALLMQNSGLGNCINTLGSLNIASQLPVVLVISQRGDLGEFNPAQVPMGQATERILDAVGIRYVMPRSVAELEAAGRRPRQAGLHAVAPRGLRAARRAHRREAGLGSRAWTARPRPACS